ncbi:hypothetical protein C8Q76DRAFT_696068 [Earliella scabrosa]|nr:hypothetical protein C8Q76DRAFT_696068 [Earliella scabrosa]
MASGHGGSDHEDTGVDEGAEYYEPPPSQTRFSLGMIYVALAEAEAEAEAGKAERQAVPQEAASDAEEGSMTASRVPESDDETGGAAVPESDDETGEAAVPTQPSANANPESNSSQKAEVAPAISDDDVEIVVAPRTAPAAKGRKKTGLKTRSRRFDGDYSLSIPCHSTPTCVYDLNDTPDPSQFSHVTYSCSYSSFHSPIVELFCQRYTSGKQPPAAPAKKRRSTAEVKAEAEKKAKAAKEKAKAKADKYNSLALMEQQQASADEDVVANRVTRRTSGRSSSATGGEVPVVAAAADKKRTRNKQKAEEVEEKRRLAEQRRLAEAAEAAKDMMEVDGDTRFPDDVSSLSSLADEEEAPTPRPDVVGDADESDTETDEENPRRQKKRRKLVAASDVDDPIEEQAAQIRARQANSERLNSAGAASHPHPLSALSAPRTLQVPATPVAINTLTKAQKAAAARATFLAERREVEPQTPVAKKPAPKPVKKRPLPDVPMVDAEAVQVKPAAAKSVGKAATRGSKKKAEEKEFEDYDANEYVDVNDSNGYAESGNEDEEAAAAKASPPKKGVRVNSSSLVKFEPEPTIKIKKKAVSNDIVTHTKDDEDDAPPKKKVVLSSSASRIKDEEDDVPPKKSRNKGEEDAAPPKKKAAPSSSASRIKDEEPKKKSRNKGEEDDAPPKKKAASSSASHIKDEEGDAPLKKKVVLSSSASRIKDEEDDVPPKKSRNKGEEDAAPPKKKAAPSSSASRTKGEEDDAPPKRKASTSSTTCPTSDPNMLQSRKSDGTDVSTSKKSTSLSNASRKSEETDASSKKSTSSSNAVPLISSRSSQHRKDDVVEVEDASPQPPKKFVRTTGGSKVNVKVEEAERVLFGKDKQKALKKKARKASTPVASDDDAGEHQSSPPPQDGRSRQSAIDLDDPQEKGKRKSWTNADLPPGAHHKDRWKTMVLPTLVWYLGTQKYPWLVEDDELCRVLQQIWNVVYGKRLPHVIKTGEAVHGLAIQRVYEWRGSFGSNALRALTHFFEKDSLGKKFRSDDDRALFCTDQLQNGQILYESTDYRMGLYRSKHVLRTLAPHLETIKNAREVPGLVDDPNDDYPYGALGLAATAVYRAALLYKVKRVITDGGKITIAKVINQFTGKESKETDFSEANFGDQTKRFVKAAMNLSLEKLDKIYNLAETVWSTPDHNDGNGHDGLSVSMLIDEEEDEDE